MRRAIAVLLALFPGALSAQQYDATGAMNVRCLPALPAAGSFNVTNTGTFLAQCAQSGSWTTTANAGTGVFDVTPVSPAANDYLPMRLTNGSAFYSAAPQASVVSTVNSSTSVLGAGAAFTGTSEAVQDYAAIQITVFASHASATDGLSLQQSSNGTNWDIVDTYTIPATTGKVFQIPPAAAFFRVVYTNGGTLQTSFRLQTVYHYSAPRGSSQRPSDGYSNETDVEHTGAFLYGLDQTSGLWYRVRVDQYGAPSSQEWTTRIAFAALRQYPRPRR